MTHDEMVLCGDGIRRPVQQLRGSHREAYPEHYTHPLVGKQCTRPDGTAGVVERVAPTSWGQMAHFEGDGDLYFLVNSIKAVTP